LTWQLGRVVELVAETPRTKSLVLELPDWPGHRAGQHVDVRLTAEDGYQAQRSYSIASGPEDPHLVLTVERLDDGEVSPYLVDEHLLDEVAWPPAERPLIYACGPTGLVEEVADTLVGAGHDPARIRLERFGPTGT